MGDAFINSNHDSGVPCWPGLNGAPHLLLRICHAFSLTVSFLVAWECEDAFKKIVEILEDMDGVGVRNGG